MILAQRSKAKFAIDGGRHAVNQASTLSSFELPIRFLLRPSQRLLLLLGVIHLGALGCLFYADIPTAFKLSAWLVILGSFTYDYYTYVYQAATAPIELLLNDKDEWFISDKKAGTLPAVLLPGAFVHPALIVLVLRRGGGRKHNVILTGDSMSGEVFRRLSVRLKFALCGKTNDR